MSTQDTATRQLTPQALGLECPHCGCRDLRELYTRQAPNQRIMRRRRCRYCGTRVTSWEKIGR